MKTPGIFVKSGALPAGLAFALALGPVLAFCLSSNANAARIFDASTRTYLEYKETTSPSRKVPGRYQRQTVRFPTRQPKGTIIIDTRKHYLYFVLGNGKAIRYGVGLGRTGFGWKGIVKIGRKKSWPAWTPPKEMIKRQPALSKYAKGMPGGPGNPLGARALYLFDGKRDTLYRIHGTNEPWTIGLNVSSGCIRLKNDDVTHLHKRAKVGARVVVK